MSSRELLTPANLLDVNGNIRIVAVERVDGAAARHVDGDDVADAFARLQPVHFYWRADEFPPRAFGDRRSYGLVAQEVERVLPDLVTTDSDGFKAVNDSKLPLLAIQAIKELQETNDALEARLAALEARDRRSTVGQELP